MRAGVSLKRPDAMEEEWEIKVGARGRGEELSGSSLAYVTASHSWPGLKKKKKKKSAAVAKFKYTNTRTHILAWCIVRADLHAWFLLLLSFCTSPFLNSRFCVFFSENCDSVCVSLYGPRDQTNWQPFIWWRSIIKAAAVVETQTWGNTPRASLFYSERNKEMSHQMHEI